MSAVPTMPGWLPGAVRRRPDIEDGALVRPVHIVASPFKTGTSSVAKALTILGVGRKIMRYDRRLQQRIRPLIRAANQRANAADDFAGFQTEHTAAIRDSLAELVAAIEPYDIFHDAPFGHTHLHPFVRKVLAPNARFIWVHRATDAWIESVRAWETAHPEIYPNHTRWTDDPEGQAETRRKFWRKHLRRFRRLKRARPEDCFELDWSEIGDFKALAAIYDLPAPDRAFPKINVSRARK